MKTPLNKNRFCKQATCLCENFHNLSRCHTVPKSVVHDMGIGHVGGILLYGPPGRARLFTTPPQLRA